MPADDENTVKPGPQKQAIAMALSMARKARDRKMSTGGVAEEHTDETDIDPLEELLEHKMASGGMVDDDYPSEMEPMREVEIEENKPDKMSFLRNYIRNRTMKRG